MFDFNTGKYKQNRTLTLVQIGKFQ